MIKLNRNLRYLIYIYYFIEGYRKRNSMTLPKIEGKGDIMK